MIDNACNRKTKDLSSALPNVGAAVMEILMPCRASYIQKQQIAGYTQEVLIDIITKVSIQSINPQQLKMLPEGQRIWKNYTIYALSNLDLEPDEVFTINYIKYRILAKIDWVEYGYIEYSTVEDYKMNAPDPTEGTGYVT
jgi:hypothetical protein